VPVVDGRAAWGTGAAPAPGVGHLPGDGDWPRPDQVVGLRGGPAQQGPWPGRAGLWGAGDRPCCGIAGAGADGPRGLTWGPGAWAGWGEPRGGSGGGWWCPGGYEGKQAGGQTRLSPAGDFVMGL